jgi:Protein of unknown function (DUF2946)
MQWFRANLKVGARLGLLALALQIVLSFGHVHLGGLRHSADRPSVAGTYSVPSDPQQQPISDADEYCAICASIHLAATSLLPQSPHLSVPFAVRRVEHSDFIPANAFSPRRASFQSRAPPLA